MQAETNTVINIEDEMRQSYMDYAMSVIIGRALPDVRDGLKPVQRRVLYAMLGEGLASNRKHSKCAGVVGEVLKRLHPHGDQPVYEALVRLAQPWSLRYPLVDGQGNFGSLDGDPPAAYRYTECRMTSLAEKILQDIDQETVSFIPNFDDSNVEPVVLPCPVPNLLINGSDGIAVGMATHIPPHNITEVINGTLELIDRPEATISELMRHIPGPDFPTSGMIIGRAAIREAYQTGRGIIHIRARAHFETLKGKREVEAIIVTEIPFQVNKARLVEKIAELMTEKTIEGISRLRDESDRKGIRIVMELKRDATKEVVLNQLFKLTPMQSSFGIINLAIVEGKPTVCTLSDLLRHFIDHRRDVVTRRTQFQLRKALARMHLLEGFMIALANLDAVIALIKSSHSPSDAKFALIEKYDLSDLQAQAILELRLQKLTGMERDAIETEHRELAERISDLESILSSSSRIDQIIKQELEEVREKFGDERRTEIVESAGEFQTEDLIEDESMVISLSHNGYIKRTPASVYRSQKRGGKGVSGASSKDEDFIEHLFVASTLSDLLIFTSLGRLHWLKAYEIPETSRTARGRALVNILSFKENEKVAAVISVRDYDPGKHLIMATRQGLLKRIELMEFSRARKGGVMACGLNPDDSLIGVQVSSGSDDILLATSSGMSIRFPEGSVRDMGRSAKGVRAIRLSPGDQVVGMTIVRQEGQSEALFTICENGYGKRTSISDYRPQNRGGKGLIDIQTSGRNGAVIGAFAVTDDSCVMLITSSGKIIKIDASDVSVIGRNTKGVRLINLDESEKVMAAAFVAESEGEDDEDPARVEDTPS